MNWPTQMSEPGASFANPTLTSPTASSNRRQNPLSNFQTSVHHSSAVGIDLGPARIDFLPLLLCDLPVLRCPVQSLCSQTHIHIVFEICAHADRLPEETFSLAFVERGHDFFAAWEEVVSYEYGLRQCLRIPTDIVLGVKMRMHNC